VGVETDRGALIDETGTEIKGIVLKRAVSAAGDATDGLRLSATVLAAASLAVSIVNERMTLPGLTENRTASTLTPAVRAIWLPSMKRIVSSKLDTSPPAVNSMETTGVADGGGDETPGGDGGALGDGGGGLGGGLVTVSPESTWTSAKDR